MTSSCVTLKIATEAQEIEQIQESNSLQIRLMGEFDRDYAEDHHERLGKLPVLK